MRRSSSVLTLIAVFLVASVAAQATSGWPDTIRLLTREKTKAKACVALLKSAGDQSAIQQGAIDYEGARAASDGVIAGFTTALVVGGKPQDFKTIQADLEEAGAGLQKVCDAAVKAADAAKGTKGGPLADVVTAAVEPLIGALKEAAGALWANHIEMAKLEQEMIEKQLEAAKWPEFGP
jgi:hypothetical protein